MKSRKYSRLLTITCIAWILVTASPEHGTGQIPQGTGFILSGTLTQQGKKLDSGSVYLRFGVNGQVDTARIKNGQFILKDTLSEAGIAWLSFSGAPQQVKALFVAPGRLTLKGDLDRLAVAKVDGSLLQASFEQWSRQWYEIHQEAGKYYQALNAATDNGKKEAPDSVRRYVDEGFSHLSWKTDSSVLSFIRQYPASPVSAYIVVSRYVDYPNEQMLDSCRKLLGARAKASYYGRIIEQQYADYMKTAIGATPVLSLPDSSGKTVSLSDFRGKYVLVDFWASWCSPCRRENPNVVAAYQQFHPLGLELLGISLDEQKQSWLKAVHQDGLSWQQLSDLKGWQSGPVKAFGIKSIPFNFLVDKTGKIVAKNLRGKQLEQTLRELLGSAD